MDNEFVVPMQMLSNRPYLIPRDVEASAGITRRQVIYRIRKANDLLRQYHVPIIITGTAEEV